MSDSITVEVVRHALLASAEEMARSLCRTAYNSVIYEVHDYSIGIHDAECNVVADTPGVVTFTGANDIALRHAVAFVGRERLQPGDVFLLNYPYWSCAHTLDALVFCPIFAEDELMAFAACRVHLLDLKQKDPGYVLDSTDMFQEGMVFPAVKLYERGVIREDVFNIVRFNSRMPEETLGDLQAQVSACQTGERRVQAIARKYGAKLVIDVMQEIGEHGHRLALAGLRRLPRGTWSAVGWVDTDGVDLNELVRMEVTVTIAEEKMVIDWSKTEWPARGPINLPRGLTVGASMLVFKALTTPDSPVTAGNFRALEVITKPGSMMDAVPPMPTFTLWPNLLAPEIILHALAQGMPDVVPACSGGDVCSIMMVGKDLARGTPWNEAVNDAVGFGGHARDDGESGIMHLTEPGCRNVPVEVLESKAPVIVESYGYRPDSEGAGKYRGGFGVQRTYRLLAPASAIVLNYKTRTLPWSIGAGLPGMSNKVVVRPGTRHEASVGPSYNQLGAGERISNLTGGGGGWGDPKERDRARVSADVRSGLLSVERASSVYGVVVDPETFAVDEVGTQTRRGCG